MLCVWIIKIATLCTFFGASTDKLVCRILRACVKTIGYARASGISTFSVSVILKIYLSKIAPSMLVSARYCRNLNRNIASLSVRCRCCVILWNVHPVRTFKLSAALLLGGFS